LAKKRVVLAKKRATHQLVLSHLMLTSANYYITKLCKQPNKTMRKKAT